LAGVVASEASSRASTLVLGLAADRPSELLVAQYRETLLDPDQVRHVCLEQFLDVMHDNARTAVQRDIADRLATRYTRFDLSA
jgi:hypothetical protein